MRVYFFSLIFTNILNEQDKNIDKPGRQIYPVDFAVSLPCSSCELSEYCLSLPLSCLFVFSWLILGIIYTWWTLTLCHLCNTSVLLVCALSSACVFGIPCSVEALKFVFVTFCGSCSEMSSLPIKYGLFNAFLLV